MPNPIKVLIVEDHAAGWEATRAIRQTCPTVKVLVLTAYDDDSYGFHAAQAGAAGYLLKEAPITGLVSAIRSAYSIG